MRFSNRYVIIQYDIRCFMRYHALTPGEIGLFIIIPILVPYNTQNVQNRNADHSWLE